MNKSQDLIILRCANYLFQCTTIVSFIHITFIHTTFIISNSFGVNSCALSTIDFVFILLL